MAGICGWYTSDEHGQYGEGVIKKMSACLPPGSNQIESSAALRKQTGQLAGSFHAHDVSAGIATVIEGEPNWSTRNLASIAANHGHGRALIDAYLQNKREFLSTLHGSFALAIVDENLNELLLAVDRFGQRPLCYARTNTGHLVFGSTTNAVLAHSEVDENLSMQAIYDYMYFHVVPSPATAYTGIAKLEPGQMLRSDRFRTQTHYYWTPSFEQRRDVNPEALRLELRDTLQKSINQCQPDDATGCFLSGGLDSSTVAGLANNVSAKPIRAYSIGFEQEGYDEMRFAKIAANHFGLELRDYYVSPEDIAEAMPLIAAAYDEPFGNSSAVPAYFCAKLAKKEGVNRLLAGDGGDEIFGGNERYAKQHVFERYEKIPRWIRSNVIEPALVSLPTDWNVITRKARRYVEQARVPLPERLQTYNYLHLNSPQDVFASDFIDKVDTQSPIENMGSWYVRPGNADLLNKMLFFDWKLTLADNDLRKVNRMCEIAGVAVQYPLLNDRLIELSTKIPSKLKMKNNQLRFFFKSALESFLPPQILTKEKHGFGLPFGEWLRTSDILREAVMPQLALLKDRRIFKPSFIDDLIHKHASEHAAYYGNIIWVLTMLEMWLQTHSQSTLRN